MPEHIHLLFTPIDIPLERAMQFIKGGYSHAVKEQLRSNLEIWERGFTDHRVRDIADFEQHRVYIHDNPVKRGLVDAPSKFRFSSAFPGFKLDPFPTVVAAAVVAAC
jgi:REP-associated tyrosine transposase